MPNGYINNTSSWTCSSSQKQFVDTHFVYGTQDPKHPALLCFCPVVDNRGQISLMTSSPHIGQTLTVLFNFLPACFPDSFISVRGVQVKVQCVRFAAIILVNSVFRSQLRGAKTVCFCSYFVYFRLVKVDHLLLEPPKLNSMIFIKPFLSKLPYLIVIPVNTRQKLVFSGF